MLLVGVDEAVVELGDGHAERVFCESLVDNLDHPVLKDDFAHGCLALRGRELSALSRGSSHEVGKGLFFLDWEWWACGC